MTFVCVGNAMAVSSNWQARFFNERPFWSEPKLLFSVDTKNISQVKGFFTTHKKQFENAMQLMHALEQEQAADALTVQISNLTAQEILKKKSCPDIYIKVLADYYFDSEFVYEKENHPTTVAYRDKSDARYVLEKLSFVFEVKKTNQISEVFGWMALATDQSAWAGLQSHLTWAKRTQGKDKLTLDQVLAKEDDFKPHVCTVEHFGGGPKDCEHTGTLPTQDKMRQSMSHEWVNWVSSSDLFKRKSDLVSQLKKILENVCKEPIA